MINNNRSKFQIILIDFLFNENRILKSTRMKLKITKIMEMNHMMMRNIDLKINTNEIVSFNGTLFITQNPFNYNKIVYQKFEKSNPLTRLFTVYLIQKIISRFENYYFYYKI